MIPLLTTLVLFVTVGAAARRLLRSPLTGSALDRVAEHYLFGLATNGVILFALGVLGVRLGAVTFIAIFALSLAAIVMSGSRKETDGPRPRYPAIPTIILFIPFIAIAADAMWVPLRDYDGRAFWILKAKAIVEEESIDGPFFQGRTAVNFHSEYPLLMPLNAATVMKMAGDTDDRQVRWIYALAALGLCLVVRAQIGHHFGAPAGAWSAVGILWLPQIAAEIEGGAMSAFNDIPLAAFIAAAFFTIVRRGDGWERSAGIWIAALVLTKNEGTIIAVLLALLAITLWMRKSGERRISFWFSLPVPPLAAASLLAIWRADVPFEHGKDYGRLIQDLPSKWSGFPAAALALLRHGVDWSHWGAFWIVVVLAVAVTLIWRRSDESVAAVVLMTGILLPYILAYTVTNWNVIELANTSANRLLTHMIGPAIFVIAAAGWRGNSAVTAASSGRTFSCSAVFAREPSS